MRKNKRQKDKEQTENQFNFEFVILSSEKQQYSPLKKHFFEKKDKKPKQKKSKETSCQRAVAKKGKRA